MNNLDTLHECYARLENNELTVGNAHIERRWRLDPATARLFPVSFRDRQSETEWLIEPTPDDQQPAPCPGSATAAPVDEQLTVTLTERRETASPVGAPSLVAELAAGGDTYRFQIFPAARGVVVSLRAAGMTAPAQSAPTQSDAPTGIERDETTTTQTMRSDVCEHFALAPPHLRLTQITLHDQTDRHNELVHEREWLLHTNEGPLALEGNLFVVENVLTRAGLVFLKHAPLPAIRPVKNDHDLLVHPARRTFTFLGHGLDPLDQNGGEEGYRFVTLAYAGGAAGRARALQTYQRQLRVYEPGRDGVFLSNTWGDRSRDGRINETFLHGEVLAAARLSVDVVQIDDGWQAGTTSNSVNAAQASGGVWEGFHAAHASFWSPHPERFPRGLVPLIELASQKGLQFGLWFAPDSTNDFANWRRDADTLLDLHQTYGVRFFKIDGVKIRTKTGERNLRAFYDAVLEGSKGAVVFDQDVTAETRPGYVGMMDVGPLFVENRYTDSRRYWPHATLRNLWKLSHWIDPIRLRLEWLNNARNAEKYADSQSEADPLAPTVYRPDYLFATVMFASPLGWFEVQNLKSAYFKEAGPLVEVWKTHRDALREGTILPLGDAPDGTCWTGFASLAGDCQSAYVLIFRELNDRPGWSVVLPGLVEETGGKWAIEKLGGDGSVTMLPRGRLAVNIAEPQRFVFARVTKAAS